MRIISGKARGKQLATVQGQEIRPTSDRVREALFSSLTCRLGSFEQLVILDLFAGTGALALEALSRGAGEAVLVDSGRQSQRLIEKNSQICGLSSQCRLLATPVDKALPRLSRPFDVIFLDPPYRQGLVDRTILQISELNLLAAGGIICAEEDKGTLVSDLLGRYHLVDLKQYGSTALHIFTHAPTEEAS